MANEPISYDRRELLDIVKVLRTLPEDTQTRTKQAISKLTDKELSAIRAAAAGRTKSTKIAVRIAEGGKAKKSSLLGEIQFGFASQRFSGGGTTQLNENGGKGLLGGMEFGSNRYKQFPDWSGLAPNGRGSRGWFIYPTIRGLQPEVIKEFENIVEAAVKEWDKNG